MHTTTAKASTATGIWLMLVLLTLSTYAVGESHLNGPVIVAVVLGTAFVKGQLVVEWFMGLRRVRPLWRLIMFTYMLLVCALIGLGYAVGLH
ncbi:MAG: cytochrome C oxidase subunit IV family protein [Thiohalomonadaceae bacterium]